MKTATASILALLLVTTQVWAQPRKTTPVTTQSTLPVYNYSYSSENELSGSLGMVAGAFNLAATYVRAKTDYGFGGYLFIQSSKDKSGATIVSGVTALGALIKLVVVDKSSIKAYVAPGVGIAMIKDGAINATGGKSDENLISPTFKIGVQFKAAPNFSVGLERLQFSNWLNDSLNNYAGPAEYYSAVGSFTF